MKLRDLLDELKRFDQDDEVEFRVGTEVFEEVYEISSGITMSDHVRGQSHEFDRANHERGRLVIKLV